MDKAACTPTGSLSFTDFPLEGKILGGGLYRTDKLLELQELEYVEEYGHNAKSVRKIKSSNRTHLSKFTLMPASSQSKWILIVIAAILGISAMVIVVPNFQRGFPPHIASQLDSTNNIKELLETNKGSLKVTTAFGDFGSLSNLLKEHEIKNLKLRFVWSDPEKLEFTCVDGKIIIDKSSKSEELQKFNGQNYKEAFSGLNQVWKTKDVKLMVGDDGLPLGSTDQIGSCRLECLISNQDLLAFIKTRGEKIVDWTVRDYSIDKVYASDSKDVNWP